MRPKVVLLTLVVAMGLVALAVVLKGVGRQEKPEARKAPEPAAAAVPAAPIVPNTSNTAALLEQVRAAEVAKALDEVRELQAKGTIQPDATELLLAKVTHPEPEVRRAALAALVQLHATNALPGLEQAEALVENPREKVALMDAIDFLKLPTVTDGLDPKTNAPRRRFVMPSGVEPDPDSRKKPVQPGAFGLAPPVPPPAASAAPDQTQPAPPAPDAPPPQ